MAYQNGDGDGDGDRRADAADTLDSVATPGGTNATTVLVVDDEPMVREVLTTYLEQDGHRVASAADGATALEMVDDDSIGLVVLDLMLPAVDGLSVLAHIRRTRDVPVIVLSARGEEPDRILGFELGADDYVVKPFSPREVVARVRSVLRRSQVADDRAPIVHGDLHIDRVAREVHLADELVAMTPREFDLLAFLADAPRQVFRRAELLEAVWDSSADYQDPSTVTVHVRRLRNKIEPDPTHPRHLVTVWGVGYRFEP